MSDADNGPDAEPGSESGEQSPLDVDSAFAAIIANWGTETTGGGWPSAEDLPSTDRAGEAAPAAGDVPPAAQPPAPPAATRPPARGEPLIPHIGRPPERAEAADEERFVPPEPPPLPRGDAFTMLAWAGVLLGPVFLLVCVVWKEAPQTYILAAVVAFVGGFATLVMRMPKHRDDDDDDGAVV